MDSVYSAVIAFILLFPWGILAVTILGHLHARLVHKGRSIPRDLPR
ncbi:MAG: hypothetical protein HYT85_17140 [candidate division NC10 bacterium]|nr:hypothetical protein [candidate division NC10 bacterium]MBI2163856.1 hypothetical protein [candidate division NC10 bacterium]MBI2457793.1 hypothetical protein [candidate division NC10 bacterium]